MIERKIYSHLSTTTAITAVVGTRIYPYWLPDQAKYPAISYFRVSGGQQNTLSGYSNLENPRIQFDVWAESYKQAKEIRSAVHSVMSQATAFQSLLIDDSDIYEDDIAVYRVSMDFSCWNRE